MLPVAMVATEEFWIVLLEIVRSVDELSLMVVPLLKGVKLPAGVARVGSSFRSSVPAKALVAPW